MAKKINPIIKIFMERDGETLEEAKRTYKNLKEDILNLIEEYGDDPVAAYEYVTDELALYDLEPDYLDYLIF